MADQKQLPAFIGNVHRSFFTPYVAILITAGLMLLLTLKSSFVAALTISTLARLVTYGATCLALPVLRRRTNQPAAAFRLPAGPIIAVFALVLIVWLLLHSTLAEAEATAWAGGVGLLIYLVYWLYSRSRSS
jgi:amino acid transporter